MNISEYEVSTHSTTWNSNSSVLCNYMKKKEYLELILKNKAIIPRYVTENYNCAGLKNGLDIAFPMTCFCDIPFSKSTYHMFSYGHYGIAFDKMTAIRKYKIQPIHYMNENSPLYTDFNEVFTRFFYDGSKIPAQYQPLLNYLLSTMFFMKPIYKQKIVDGEEKVNIYQNECEWRYIPSKMPNGIPFVLYNNFYSEKSKITYSDVLKLHQDTWLKFDLEDIKYLIVPDDDNRDTLIAYIRNLEIESHENDCLISKIEIAKSFSEDL